MKNQFLQLLILAAGMAAMALTAALAAGQSPLSLQWETVVNNNTTMPGAIVNRTFNSYNQPSVNSAGLVVLRARSIGGNGVPATHGIYTRDMSANDNPVIKILDRGAPPVPSPNNLETLFIETPSFPRIDIRSNTIATRGNHPPVWRYGIDADETRAGTTGIYTNPFGVLITGASKLGNINGFEFYEVPGTPSPWKEFDVFPGSPSVTDGSTIVFKGNYTVDGQGRTGVFYRNLNDADFGGTTPVRLIANNTETLIPDTQTVFGSTSPPSAADGKAVFAGFDNEDEPTMGGLYLANLWNQKKLVSLVEIGGKVPGVRGQTFNRIGEALAFDGVSVGFWGAWGTETRDIKLYCPTEGNKDRIAYCNGTLVCSGSAISVGDPETDCEEEGIACHQHRQVPVHQGIFVHDTSKNGSTRMVAATGDDFEDFLFWNYSGKTPCMSSGGHGGEGAEDDGEPVRWRSSSFVATSGPYTAFKAATGGETGIYIKSATARSIWTVLDTTMPGQALDPDAPDGSSITEVGLEREGLRGTWLAINARMSAEGVSPEGHEEEGMAGIYITRVPIPPIE